MTTTTTTNTTTPEAKRAGSRLADAVGIPTRVFFSLVCVVAHLLFLYGQTQIMWYLYFKLEVDASLAPKSMPARIAFRALSLPNPVSITTSINHTIEEFTYWDAIHGLWTGNNGPLPPGIVNPGPGPWGKFSAALLVVFSAFWPHAKLVMLQGAFFLRYARGNEEARTTRLYWLDTFGKWSLADVFVICCLLAVLNLSLIHI